MVFLVCNKQIDGSQSYKGFQSFGSAIEDCEELPVACPIPSNLPHDYYLGCAVQPKMSSTTGTKAPAHRVGPDYRPDAQKPTATVSTQISYDNVHILPQTSQLLALLTYASPLSVEAHFPVISVKIWVVCPPGRSRTKVKLSVGRLVEGLHVPKYSKS